MEELEKYLSSQFNPFNQTQINNSLLSFKTLCESYQPTTVRKSGFLGYLCFMSVLSKANIEEGIITALLNNIINDLLIFLQDNDSKIISACAECLFYIMKFFKEYVLTHFNKFLEGLLILFTVQSAEIKTIATNLDSFLKSVINFLIQGDLPDNFDLLDFFQIIIDKIKLKHPSIKCVVVSWIIFINQIPEIKLINILQMFLPDLFDMLSIPCTEVNECAEKCLKDLYTELENGFNNLRYDVEVELLEIVVEKSESDNVKVKIVALNWISLFLQKYSVLFIQNSNIRNLKVKKSITKILSNQKVNQQDKTFFTPKETLFDLGYSPMEDLSLSKANSSIETRRQFPYKLFSKILGIILVSVSNEELRLISMNINTLLMRIVDYYDLNYSIKIFGEVLIKYFSRKEQCILELVFQWVEKLFNNFHEETFSNFFEFMNKFLDIIEHDDYHIFDKAISTLCNIAKYKAEYTEIIITNIMNKIKNVKPLLKTRGNEIFCKLCGELKVDKVFLTFAKVLSETKEEDFAQKMINILTLFLLSSKETKSLRISLKNVQRGTNQQVKAFFLMMFKTWCINPISTLVLCLISEFFELSYYLTEEMKDLELSNEIELELGQLVGLIESKMFMSKKHILIKL